MAVPLICRITRLSPQNVEADKGNFRHLAACCGAMKKSSIEGGWSRQRPATFPTDEPGLIIAADRIVSLAVGPPG